MIKDIFKKEYLDTLDLTENEFKFYLTLVKLGKCSVQKAAREMGIFRSSAYVLVESLIKKGLISQEFKARGRYLIPEPPKILTRLIEDKQRKVEKTKAEIEDKIPDLLGLYGKSLKDPVIKVYEGAEGLKAIHEDILETGKTLYCYPRLGIATEVLPMDFQLRFVKKRVEKGIKAKVIAPRSEGTDLIIKKSKEVLGGKNALREIRVLPDPLKESLTAEKMFYGDKVVYMTYGKKVTGILIEHEEIAKLEKKHFNIIWRSSLPYNV